MSKWNFLLAALLFSGSVFAGDMVCTEENQDLEEEECTFIDEEEKPVYESKHRCPTCRRHYHDYENRDIDATWPGKNEDSFRDSLTR